MSATKSLTTALQRQVLLLEDDIRERVERNATTRGTWTIEHARAADRGRTASSWQAWRDDRVTQVAVAWVLATVFVRFCEDNGLVQPVWIVGPGARRQEALDAENAFYRERSRHADVTAREWLLEAIAHLGSLPATKALVDEHSPLWLASPSGDAVVTLMSFWRQRSEDGALVHHLADAALDTRFLGDLYQDLSEHAKDTYALLQTPVFVEEFILDRTLEPALAERPLEGFHMIDPACGSGHFLLGAFARLLDRWHREAPGLEVQARVQAALDAVHGVDLNPFAVAIARFRLTVTAMSACGLESLESAPAFRIHLAVGDSLLHGPGQQTLHRDADLSGFAYATEDLDLLQTILTGGRYDVVVGNPPYITVKDRVLNHAYRTRYSTCSGKYSLTVPFMERFFELAKPGHEGQPAGWAGQVTSNSFMKREFGRRLIEDFLAVKDLRLVADTSGAFIPGHGTPTVILVGRNQRPVKHSVRAVLGIRGEPGRPESPADGIVWTSIVKHVDEPGWDDAWISVVDLGRQALAFHPWSLTGGGAASQVETIYENSALRLGDRIVGKIGPASFTGSDDCFLGPEASFRRKRLPEAMVRPLVTGDVVRDWLVAADAVALVPYGSSLALLPLDRGSAWAKWLWPNRTVLGSVVGFNRETRAEAGAAWWGWYRWVASRYTTPLSLTFAVVATHNHFVLTRGGGVFSRHAPVIKLPAGATEDEHLALLAVLNSSTACFWLKQNSHNKGNEGYQSGIKSENWERFWEFTGTTLQDYPLPVVLPLQRGRRLDALARESAAQSPEAVAARELPTGPALVAARTLSERLRARMIAVQEELDWEVYRHYRLISDNLTYPGDDLPGLALGERAFEIALARQVAAGENETAWLTRHGSISTTELPAQWPRAYRDLVQRRLDLIAGDPALRLLEKPEHKRRWAAETWDKRQEQALRGWLLERLEDPRFWFDRQGRPVTLSVGQLADAVGRDADLVSVLTLWEGRPDLPVTQSLVRLFADESVPYLAAFRYRDSGLRKREAWEATWALQRREDAGEQVGTIPVPPKYTSADFRKVSYWQARGKLDVPKERFILYPDAGRATDPTPLLGWAGWDHAEQALALNRVIADRESDGWDDTRLIPMVAGLAELQPWVEQWHSGLDPVQSVDLAQYCREELSARAAQVGRTLRQLGDWRPEPATRGRRPKNIGAS